MPFKDADDVFVFFFAFVEVNQAMNTEATFSYVAAISKSKMGKRNYPVICGFGFNYTSISN